MTVTFSPPPNQPKILIYYGLPFSFNDPVSSVGWSGMGTQALIWFSQEGLAARMMLLTG